MRILITTDGSDFSTAAVEKACEIVADAARTEFKIVSVYEFALPLDVFPSPDEFHEKLETNARQQAEEFAESAANIVRSRFPDNTPSIETEVAPGAPEQVVVETAREWNADMIVVGSHGRGFWERMLLGSTTDALVHHAPCSVLVVRRKSE